MKFFQSLSQKCDDNSQAFKRHLGVISSFHSVITFISCLRDTLAILNALDILAVVEPRLSAGNRAWENPS